MFAQVMKPIVATEFNERAYLDLIDMASQPDGLFTKIWRYQEKSTAAPWVGALTRASAREVAFALLPVFAHVGAPDILCCDNGSEFLGELIVIILHFLPWCKIINGSARHPQSQGQIERSNARFKDGLQNWMRDNRTDEWVAVGIHVINGQIMTRHHYGRGHAPYDLLYGQKKRSQLNATLKGLNPKVLEAVHFSRQFERC
eukprot:3862428-Prymnesium_polylepis.2